MINIDIGKWDSEVPVDIIKINTNVIKKFRAGDIEIIECFFNVSKVFKGQASQ